MQQFAKILSWVFLPLLMPVYALLLAMFTPTLTDFDTYKDSLYVLTAQGKWFYLYAFLVFGFLAPGVSLLILKRAKMISSIHLEKREDRFAPLITTLAYSVLLYLMLSRTAERAFVSPHVFALVAAAGILSILFFVLSKWTKVSLHTGGAGLFFGFVLAYFSQQIALIVWGFVIVLLVVGLVIFARLILNKHTPKQAYLGFFIGNLTTYFIDILYIHI